MLELVDPQVVALVGAGARAARDGRTAAKALARGIGLVTDRAGFEALADDWRALDAEAEGAVLFQSFDWCNDVLAHHEAQGHSFEPLIVTLRVGGRLVGLLPLQMKRSGMTCTATGFGEPYQQYSDVRLATDAPTDAAERLLDAACRLPGCDGLSLLKVRDDSLLAPLLKARRAVSGNADAAPFVDLTPFEDFKAYHATVKAKTRKNIRNARNRLARDAEVTHRLLTDPAEIEALVTRAHKGREAWLEAQGLTSRAFRDPSFGDFARSVVASGSGLSVLAMSLRVDGKPIADQWGFVFNNRYYAYVATWDPDFEESSPGKLHLEEVIHICMERGLAVADFLIPAARYKFTWTDKAMPVADYSIPLSLAARLEASLWSGGLRPVLKRAALRLPAPVRARIAKIILRR